MKIKNKQYKRNLLKAGKYCIVEKRILMNPNLTTNDKLIFIYLSDQKEEKKNGTRAIAFALGIARNTVKDSIKRLLKEGFLGGDEKNIELLGQPLGHPGSTTRPLKVGQPLTQCGSTTDPLKGQPLGRSSYLHTITDGEMEWKETEIDEFSTPENKAFLEELERLDFTSRTPS